MPPTLVHGVDISTLEGWMVKMNSNPSMFGKSHSRRWFRVSFVPAGNDQKLIISYSTNKTSKEPRGWLYIEDVSGVYCRRDIIEVVSPARTLRFKGETTVEHRLWSDSLHKLCNPPKPVAEDEKRLVAESAVLHERQRERLRAQDRDRIADPKKTREYVDASRQQLEEAKPAAQRRSVAEAASPRDHSPQPRRRESAPEQRDVHRRGRRNDSGESEESASDPSEDEEEARPPPPRRRQSNDSIRDDCVDEQASSSRKATRQSNSPHEKVFASGRRSQRDDEYEEKEDDERRRRHEDRDVAIDDDDEDDEDDEEEEELRRRRASQGASQERRPSLLVASIKSLSPVVATPAQPKTVPNVKPSESKAALAQSRQASPAKHDAKAGGHSDEEDDDDEDHDEDPQKESPREEVSREPTSQPAGKSTTHSTDYFDDDEEEETNNKRRPSIPTAQAAAALKTATTAPVSEVRADNNFVEDDWDAEEPTPAPSAKHREATHPSPEKRAGAGFGGVAADTNFATEDWD